jgi:hypothetical protein
MEQCIPSSCTTKNSVVRSRETMPGTKIDMFGQSDLKWDAERRVNVMTW